MIKLRTLLVGASLALAFVMGFALAQPVVQTVITGSETWTVGQGPGGPGAFINIDTVRGSEPMATKSGSGAATSTAVAGTLCWVGTAPTTWAVTLPVAPANGTFVKLCSDTTLTTLVTVTAGTGDTLTTTFNSQTITANASFPQWQYLSATKIWYRVQ
jgi:hypothetical protein